MSQAEKDSSFGAIEHDDDEDDTGVQLASVGNKYGFKIKMTTEEY